MTKILRYHVRIGLQRLARATKVLLIVGAGLSLPQSVSAQSWSERAPLPSPREFHATCSIGEQVYVFGGATEHLPEGMIVTQTNRYNASSNSWAVLGEMPAQGGTAHGINGLCYVIGGPMGVRHFNIYDPLSDSWTESSESPVWVTGHMSVVHGDRIYIANGLSPGSSSNLIVYDPGNDQWELLAPMPTVRRLGAAAAVRGKLYFTGGATSEQGQIFDIVEVYNPVTDSWAEASSMPRTLRYHAACTVGGNIWVTGGVWAAETVSDRVYIYDPASDSWSTGPQLPGLRNRHKCELVGENLYLFGGATGTRGFPRGTMDSVISYPVGDLLNEELFLITPGLNGNWWNGLARDGEGVQIEVSDSGGGSLVLVATIYSYDTQGNQIFLIGVGTVNDDMAAVDIFITDGGLWGNNYDPALVSEFQWGTGLFKANGCDSISMVLTPNSEFQMMGFTNLAYELKRLTTSALPCP